MATTTYRALDRELRSLRRQYKEIATGRFLPTGLQCDEGCDHAHQLCAIGNVLRRHVQPIVDRAAVVKAALEQTDGA